MNVDLAVRSHRSELAEGVQTDDRAEKLPREHPRQPQDAIALSSRAKELALDGKRPQPIAVATFWDHPQRSAQIGARRVTIDPSASYRLE